MVIPSDKVISPDRLHDKGLGYGQSWNSDTINTINLSQHTNLMKIIKAQLKQA